MNLLIISKIFKPHKVLLDWIDKDRLVWSTLSMNPNAVDMFESNKDKLIMSRVVLLKEAIGFIEKNVDMLNKDDWDALCENPAAIELLKRNPERININRICANVNGTEILKRYIDEHDIFDTRLEIVKLCMNPSVTDILNMIYDDTNTDEENIIISQKYFELLLGNPNMMKINIIKNNLEFLMYMNIDVSCLFENTNEELKDIMLNNVDLAVKQRRFRSMSMCIFAEEIYIDILKIFDKDGVLIDPDREYMVDWTSLCKNKNAIRLIRNNLEKVDWRWLSSNPSAIDLIKDDKANINWAFLSLNPSIFKDSYDRYIEYIDVIDMIFTR